jgi:hypothetical protein
MTEAPRADGEYRGARPPGSGCRRWTAGRGRAPSHPRPAKIALLKFEQRPFKKVASMVPTIRQNVFSHGWRI